MSFCMLLEGKKKIQWVEVTGKQIIISKLNLFKYRNIFEGPKTLWFLLVPDIWESWKKDRKEGKWRI